MSQMQDLLDEVRGLRDKQRDDSGYKGAHPIAKSVHSLVENALTHILAKYESQPEPESGKWISVKERVPEVGEVVRWKGKRWRYCVSTEFDDLEDEYLGVNTITGTPMADVDQDTHWNELTHWQPLPAPPDNNQHGRRMAGAEIESAQDTPGGSTGKHNVSRVEPEQEAADD